MSDGRQPLTAAFLRAKRVADGLRPASAKARLTRDQLTEYRNAVADFEVAFDVAERDARRIKDSSFTVVERKRLDTAKQLLTIAIDQAATPAERQVAYRRVREELDGLISLSDEAIEVLEGKVSLELTTGVMPQASPADPSRTPATPPARATGCRRPARPDPGAAAVAARAVAGALAHLRHGPGSRHPPQVAPLSRLRSRHARRAYRLRRGHSCAPSDPLMSTRAPRRARRADPRSNPFESEITASGVDVGHGGMVT